LSKVTLIWFSETNQPFKVLSIRKSLIYLLVGAGALATVLAALFIWLTHVLHQDLQAYQSKTTRLQQQIAEKQESLEGKLHDRKERIEKLEQAVAAKKSSIEELKTRLSQSQKELETIRDMELKVRRYLGLESDESLTMGNQTHQGGFTSMGTRLGDMPSAANATAESNVVSYSLSLKESLSEVLSSLKQREKTMRQRPSILPVQGEDIWLSCSYGWRRNPFTSRKEFHAAIDVAGAWRTPIIAPADGKVIKKGRTKIWGRYLRIQHGSELVTAYGHLHSFEVEEGDWVKRRQVIGYMGNTGHSTGTHLHYKVVKDGKHVNPMQYILDRNPQTLALR
jgi:murein DD-endopeptidase MepM/ murein hydrolase activator NlpD